MDDKDSNKFAAIIIYFLTIFLIVLIIYNMILLLGINNSSDRSYKNSIEVSPISNEELSIMPNLNILYIFLYKHL